MQHPSSRFYLLPTLLALTLHACGTNDPTEAKPGDGGVATGGQGGGTADASVKSDADADGGAGGTSDASTDVTIVDAPDLNPPVCSLTGQPMRNVSRDFTGVITFELYPPLGLLHDVAQRHTEARVAHPRISAHWWWVQPTQKGAFDWTQTDARINEYTKRGIEPIVLLGYPPVWASSNPTALDPKLPNGWTSIYPPKAVSEWEGYVRAIVKRYAGKVHHWQVWNEPGGPNRFAGTPSEYVTLLNSAYNVIKQEDPKGRVWAPDIIADNQEASALVDAVLKGGKLDVFAIHTFGSTVKDMVAQFGVMQKKIHAARPELPIAVTAAQIIAPPPWKITCPYVGVSEADQAKTLTDIYVCLANAGAEHVSWYKSVDRYMDNCIDAVKNPEGLELTGVLGPHPKGKEGEMGYCLTHNCSGLHYPTKQAYFALKAIGEYVQATATQSLP